MLKNTVKPLIMTIFNTAALLPTFQSLNPGGFEGWPFYLRFYNASNAIVIISYNGVDPHFQMAPTSSESIYFGAASNAPMGSGLLAKGSQVYIFGAAGVGNFFISGYYQPELS